MLSPAIALVIARSEATKQSSSLRINWIASFARNDGLRGPDGSEKLVDLGLQPLVLVRQQLRRGQDLGGGGAGVAGAAVDVGDGGRDLGGADRRLLDATGDFLRRGALLLDGGCNRRGDFRDSSDRARNFLDRDDRFARRSLHASDLP